MIGLFTDANIMVIQARRVTVQARDIQVVRLIRGETKFQKKDDL